MRALIATLARFGADVVAIVVVVAFLAAVAYSAGWWMGFLSATWSTL